MQSPNIRKVKFAWLGGMGWELEVVGQQLAQQGGFPICWAASRVVEQEDAKEYMAE